MEITAIERTMVNDPFIREEQVAFAIPDDKDNFVGPGKIQGTSVRCLNIDRANSGALLLEDIGSDTTITYFTAVKMADGTYANIPIYDGAGTAVTNLVQSADGADQVIPIPDNAMKCSNLMLQASVVVASSKALLKS